MQTNPYSNPECECFVILMLNTRRRVKGHALIQPVLSQIILQPDVTKLFVIGHLVGGKFEVRRIRVPLLVLPRRTAHNHTTPANRPRWRSVLKPRPTSPITCRLPE